MKTLKLFVELNNLKKKKKKKIIILQGVGSGVIGREQLEG